MGSHLERDFNFTRDGTFVVDVPNGQYDVKLILGDLGPYAHDNVGVFLEGTHRDTVTTPARQVNCIEHDVEVVDGQLTLRIVDLGGRDVNGVIESLQVIASGPVVPRLEIEDIQQPEGDAGSQDWIFPITLSDATTKDITVEYSTSDDGATSGEDYTATQGTLRIPAGQVSGAIHVPVNGDETIESDEKFHLNLSGVNGATLDRAHAVGTISNDDFPPTLSVSLSTTSVSETAGAGAVTATITRSGAIAEPLIVDLSSSDTSEASTPPSVEIKSGEISANFSITAHDDPDNDGPQNVIISVSASGYVEANATLLVTDDDLPPFDEKYDFGTGGSPVAPGFTNVSPGTNYTANRGFGWTGGAIYSADRGVGSSTDRDFNFTRDGTFVVDAPNGRYQVDMTLGDLGRYAHDRVGIYLEGTRVDSVSTAAYQVVRRQYETEVDDGQLTLRILDLGGRDVNGVIESLEIVAAGPIIPELTIEDVRHVENDSGSLEFVFPVELSVATTEEVSVQFESNDNDAEAGSDYTAAGGTLKIPAGQTNGTIEVTVNGDELIETDESFFVDLTNVTGATLVRNRATGVIINDDVPPSLSVSLTPNSISEADGANATMGTVLRTGSTASAVVVNLQSDDTSEAVTPTDVEIPIGSSSATFPIEAVDDSESDGVQNVVITASAVDYLAGQAGLEVTDDDRPPFEAHYDFGTGGSPLAGGFDRVSAGTRYTGSRGYGWTAGTINDYDRGTGNAVTRDFNYTRDGTFAVDVPNGRYFVDMQLGDVGRYAHDNVGIYLEGTRVDTVSTAAYQVVSRRYETEVGDGQLTVRIADLGGRDVNGVIESLEVFAAGPIVPELSIADVAMVEGDSHEADFIFEVDLSVATSVEVSVEFATVDDSATAGSDYSRTNGTLRIPPGQTRGSIRVPVFGDESIEADETFRITLANVVNATTGDTQALGTIQNDDFPPTLSLEIAPQTISESAGVEAAIGTITRSGPTTSALTVQLASEDTSEATVPATVEIPAGDVSAVFFVAAEDDADSDGSQDVVVTAKAAGYVDGQFEFEVIDDDQPPFEAFFDFGTGGSPLSPGFARVSESTSYSASRGFGWVAGSVGSRDRNSGGWLERDIIYTRDATFVVDLPDGEYWVDTILGDKASYSHDSMGIFLEGVHAATVSTAGRQLVNRHFEVEVTDGQLTLRLLDLGGSDANVVIEGLRILSAGTDEPRSDAWWPARNGIPNALFSAPGTQGAYQFYFVESTYQRSENNIRVLLPTGYDPEQSYPVIYVLPVEKGNGRQFGDGMSSIYDHGLHRQFDAIFVSPTFSDTPWYADNISNQSIWQETYFRSVIVPFIEEQFSVIDGPEGRLLLGYSKSGYGAVSMLLRHPDYFGRALAWDAPLAMSDPSDGWDFLKVVGSRDNFHRNYQITNLLDDRGDDLKDQPPRIFLQGYSYDFTRADHAAIHAQMTNLEIPHVYEPGVYRSHLWASGWMPDAVDTLLSDT